MFSVPSSASFASLCTHRRRVSSDWLMAAPSFFVVLDVFCAARSLPARSTTYSVDTVAGAALGSPSMRGADATLMRNTACDRDETWFMAVRPTCLRFKPAATTSFTSSLDLTTRSSRFSTCVRPLWPLTSLMCDRLPSGSRESKSRISSL